MKNKQAPYQTLAEMSRNDYYTKGNLLDCSHHQDYCKFIGIDLSRQPSTSIPQQINFIEKSKDYDATMFFYAEKQQKTILNFIFISKLYICSLYLLNVTE